MVWLGMTLAVNFAIYALVLGGCAPSTAVWLVVALLLALRPWKRFEEEV